MKRIAIVFFCLYLLHPAALSSFSQAAPLAGTEPLLIPYDVIAEQLEQVRDYFLRRIDRAEQVRDERWKPSYQSIDGYEVSVAGHREDLRRMLGLIRASDQATQGTHDLLAKGKGYRLERLTISIVEGLSARGLLIVPVSVQPQPLMIVCPDADAWPESVVGIDGSAPAGWVVDFIARGAAVYVPQFVERLEDHPYCQTANKKDRREILHRLGYVVGRSVTGLDVQDVVAAVNHLANRSEIDGRRIVVVGIGQGGMTAMYAAAVDRRIAAVVVADYFRDRRQCWQEPVDRRLAGQLLEFGDAEVAALIAPRPLTVVNWMDGTLSAKAVQNEFLRAARFYRGLGATERLRLVSVPQQSEVGTETLREAGHGLLLAQSPSAVSIDDISVSADMILSVRNRHFEERLAWLRCQIDQSERARQRRWNILGQPAGEFPAIKASMLRKYREMVGCVAIEDTPARPRTEHVLSTGKHDGYVVMLDVTDGVEVYGHLLVPRGIKGRAAAVVCQHGLSGRPEMITGIEHSQDTPYHQFGRRLAEQGYVVFAPLILHQLPVQQINDQARQADTVGMMRAAMVVAKTRRVVEFLQSLEFVDPRRIGYYGLSYGGYSAIWCSPLVDQLEATVISGHFNDWRSKITSDATPTSYLRHPDEDFYQWDILHRFSHVELIAMIAPRAVAIEFGQRDGITSPAWTSYAWNQLQAIRDHLGFGNQIVLAHFDGVHEVHGIETFDFLDRLLRPVRPVGRDFANGSDFITRKVDSKNRITGEFWIPEGATELRGIAAKVSRSGSPGLLEVTFGSAPGQDDFGSVRLKPGGIADKPHFCELRVDPKPARSGQMIYFEIRAATSALDAHYLAYGPKPLGGTYSADRFPVSYWVLTDREQDRLTSIDR